jgi:hypothetical protein
MTFESGSFIINRNFKNLGKPKAVGIADYAGIFRTITVKELRYCIIFFNETAQIPGSVKGGSPVIILQHYTSFPLE